MSSRDGLDSQDEAANGSQYGTAVLAYRVTTSAP